MALQTVNQFDIGTKFSNLGTGFAQGQQMANQFQLGQQREAQAARTGTQFEQEQSVLRSNVLGTLAEQLKGVPLEARSSVIAQNAPELAKFNIDASVFQNADLSDVELDNVIAGAKSFKPTLAQTTGQRDFQSKTQGLTEEEKLKAQKVDLGLVARAGISAEERIAKDEKLAEKVVTVEGKKAEAKEEGKLKIQKKLLPSIRGAIKQAEKEAVAKGEAFTALNRAKAALPGLRDVTEKLKLLSDVATFTTGGKVLNLLAKESGFGATEGATARTTMRAVVDNQVLPLLRDTFGAAFTKAEGDSLRNTLLDPDTAPDQMKATLDAFIEQKIRNIETSERELGVESTTDLTQLSDEDLLKQLEAARGGQ